MAKKNTRRSNRDGVEHPGGCIRCHFSCDFDRQLNITEPCTYELKRLLRVGPGLSRATLNFLYLATFYASSTGRIRPEANVSSFHIFGNRLGNTSKMPSKKDIVLLATYNASMNEKLYVAAATLSQQALIADRGAFFGSILGILNHIVAGDTIWLRRFVANPSSLSSLKVMEGMPAPTGLADRYSDDLQVLLEHRRRLDAVIEALATELSDSDLEAPLLYKNSCGEFRKSFGSLLLHLFNHQTHHRGQVSTLLSQSGVDIGVTDLVEWIPCHK